MTDTAQAASPSRRGRATLWNLAALVVAIPLALALFALASPVSLTTANIVGVIDKAIAPAVIALGALPLFMAGTIDLSAAMVAVVAGIAAAALTHLGIPLALAIPLVLIFAGGIGALNAVLSTRRHPAWLALAYGMGGALFGFACLLTNGLRSPPKLGFGIGLFYFNIVTLALIAAGLVLWRRWRPADFAGGPGLRPVAATLGTAGILAGLTAVVGAPSWGLPLYLPSADGDWAYPVATARLAGLPALVLVPVALGVLVALWTRKARPLDSSGAASAAPGQMLPFVVSSMAAALAGLIELVQVLGAGVGLSHVSEAQLQLLVALLLGTAYLRRGIGGLLDTLVAVLLVSLLLLFIRGLFFPPMQGFPAAPILSAMLVGAIVWAASRHGLRSRAQRPDRGRSDDGPTELGAQS